MFVCVFECVFVCVTFLWKDRRYKPLDVDKARYCVHIKHATVWLGGDLKF